MKSNAVWLALVPTVLGQDPAPEQSKEIVLHVPFAAGERQTVCRGPGKLTHSGSAARYAVDFALDEGHPIRSASRGRVVWVKEDADKPTGDWRDNNEVAVEMPDGTSFVVYYHLTKDGAAVEVGDEVLPGDLIGYSGNTGLSEGPHLHIDVRKGHRLGPSVPWRFDVAAPGESLVEGNSVKSENVPWRSYVEPWIAFERLSALAVALDDISLAAGMRADLNQRIAGAISGASTQLEDYRKLVHERSLNAWSDVAQRTWARSEGAEDALDRAVLALTTVQCFPGTKPAELAEAFVKQLDPALTDKAKRTISAVKGKHQALKSALQEEWKLAIAGNSIPFDPKSRKRLQSAYERATRSLTEEQAKLLRQHMARIAP